MRGFYGSRRIPTYPGLRQAEQDEFLDLGDEIATLAAHLHAATYRLLVLIAEFDVLEGWKAGGHRTGRRGIGAGN
jgi:hypothetical protein